ncbi:MULTISPECIES: helix-turn-helix domain-containing protein [unclassified Paenibacillus]|uniref:Helix-turn-helix domain-containing protein n=1 Tax=Paenibacillus provencensis TaxID=441151 RepID=A0ABW3Q186_9BACL|nr:MULTISPECIES: helix-turn-helix transcriptional regulator [unclassified Paenibacillus]MCM3130613.1 helix-turn-helix transcriptional regulator [Paenibacillus sp. MER 78]SDX74473.1 Helix-turn-helix [Paenibacillus sp. PDC88]SFS89824.1 Helix-turn-helix [Paenibacillus sp. 453mf]
MSNKSNEKITTIGLDIRESRLKLKYSQAQLALKLDVDKTTISAWERDIRFPNEDYLLRLSTVLGLSLRHLLMVSKNKKMAGLTT